MRQAVAHPVCAALDFDAHSETLGQQSLHEMNIVCSLELHHVWHSNTASNLSRTTHAGRAAIPRVARTCRANIACTSGVAQDTDRRKAEQVFLSQNRRLEIDMATAARTRFHSENCVVLGLAFARMSFIL